VTLDRLDDLVLGPARLPAAHAGHFLQHGPTSSGSAERSSLRVLNVFLRASRSGASLRDSRRRSVDHLAGVHVQVRLKVLRRDLVLEATDAALHGHPESSGLANVSWMTSGSLGVPLLTANVAEPRCVTSKEISIAC
jgi:hypothetical protein